LFSTGYLPIVIALFDKGVLVAGHSGGPERYLAGAFPRQGCRIDHFA
jgi:hypothetical protein